MKRQIAKSRDLFRTTFNKFIWGRRGRRAFTLSVLAFAGCALVAFAGKAYTSPAPVAGPTSPISANPAPQPAPQPRQSGSGTVTTEIIKVLPDGFEPTEIIRPTGPFMLLVDNHSGLDELDMHLDQQFGSRLRDLQVEQEELNWSDQLDLAPGIYVFSETNHPDWVCKIVIAQ